MYGDFGCYLAVVSFGSNRQEYAADGTGYRGELRGDHDGVVECVDLDRDGFGVRRGKWRGGRYDHDHGDCRREERHRDCQRDLSPGSRGECYGRWSSRNTLKFGSGLASLHGSTEASSKRALFEPGVAYAPVH